MKYLLTILLFVTCSIGQSQKLIQQDNQALPVPKLIFDANGELTITPSATSSKSDFDFFVGKWKLHNRTLKKKPDNTIEWQEFESTQEMHTILNGLGNIDNFLAERNGKPFEGMTLRLFNPQTRLWSIYWADSNFGVLGLPPVVGSFENNVGHFFSKDTYDDKNIITVYRWDARDWDKPIWSQASSHDNGETWTWNWYMYMRR
jgi:hypothetical protein